MIGRYDLYLAYMHATQDCQSSKYQYACWEGVIDTLPTGMQLQTPNLLNTSMHGVKV